MAKSKSIPTVDQFADSFTGGFWFSAGDDKKRSKNKGDEYDWKNSVTPEQLELLNDEGWGAFFTVNEFSAYPYDENELNVRPRQNRKKEGIEYCRAVFIEDDSKQGLRTFALKPSFIVESSPDKYHYYWITHTKQFDEWELVMQTMVDEHGCDPNARDLSRVLRIPGMHHNKEKPFKVKMVGGNKKVYDWKTIKIAFPPAKVKKSNHTSTDKDDFDLASALQALTTATDFHGSMISIAASMYQQGVTRGIFGTLMQQMKNSISTEKLDDKRLQELEERFADVHLLNECYDSAVKNERFNLTTNISKASNGDIYTRHEFPHEFIGSLAKEIHQTMHHPNKEIAIIASMFICAVLCGRKDSFHGSPINLDLLLQAENGVGKETIKKSFELAIRQLIMMNVIPYERLKAFKIFNGSYGVSEIVLAMNLIPSIGMIISESGLKSKTSAGTPRDIKAFLMTNQVKAAHSLIDFTVTKGLRVAPHGVNFSVLSETTKQSNTHDNSDSGSGKTARRLKIYADHRPDDIEKKYLLKPRSVFSKNVMYGICMLVKEAMRDEEFEIPTPKEGEPTPEGKFNMSIRLKHSAHRDFEPDKYVQERMIKMRLKENIRRQETSDDDVGDTKWAHKVRKYQLVKQYAFLFARTQSVVSCGGLIVAKSHWEQAELFYDEARRAEIANLDEYLDDVEAIAYQLQQFFLHNLKNPDNNQKFKRFHSSLMIKAMIFDKAYITETETKSWKMCRELSSGNSFLSADDYLSKALDFGQSNGMWERNHKLTRGNNVKEYLKIAKVKK